MQAVASYSNVLGSKLGEIWHCDLGVALTNVSGVDYVSSWTGQLRGLVMSAPSVPKRPTYAADGTNFHGRKVIMTDRSVPQWIGAMAIGGSAPGTTTDSYCGFAVIRTRSPNPGTWPPNADTPASIVELLSTQLIGGGSSHVALYQRTPGFGDDASISTSIPPYIGGGYYISNAPTVNQYSGNVTNYHTTPQLWIWGLDTNGDINLFAGNTSTSAFAGGGLYANRQGKVDYFAIGSEEAVGGSPLRATDGSFALVGWTMQPLTSTERAALTRIATADFL
jgi:hypothetical protein